MKSPPGKETTSAPDEKPPKAAPEPAPKAAEDPNLQRIKALEDERDRLKNELADVRDRFLRARADYDNLVRRTGKESTDSIKAAKGALLLKYVAVVETLEKAVGELERTAPAHAKGLRMVLDEARKLLKEEGVREIECLGQLFNYRYHQAVESVEVADQKEGTVVDVVQRGYLIGTEILRPSLVKVATAPRKTNPAKETAAPAKEAPAGKA